MCHSAGNDDARFQNLQVTRVVRGRLAVVGSGGGELESVCMVARQPTLLILVESVALSRLCVGHAAVRDVEASRFQLRGGLSKSRRPAYGC